MPPKIRSETAAPPKPSPALATKNSYLLLYNAVSAALWASVLYKVVSIVGQDVNSGNLGKGVGGLWSVFGFEGRKTWGGVYEESEEWVRLVQTGAVLEVVHSLTGVVRAPLLTTLMQVSSRLLLTWGIAHPFPETTKYNPAFSSMLLAWSITEVIRYSYFAFSLSGVGVPAFLTWLRYNTFLILYPLGVSSEIWLIVSTLHTPPAEKMHEYYPFFLYGILVSYVPGFYTLFTYMLAQRRRILGVGKKTQ
ncbi:tyrosine phosphatase-like protein [Lophiotrema nucula]|uniref:Very-long-chain (3R)-3-hydroxyacyl-CoA dehydratase n=1 Tax=Lophiotrema nucula TaxID=690887 RepID=A0A6A5Z1X6_9PLEO|nr:tyrosine phosphatase-like protein [Lophiotrema nucula]